MNRLLSLPPVLLFLVFSAAMLMATQSNAAKLKIGGTGTDLGTMQMLAEALQQQMPGLTIDIQPSIGSSGGIAAALAGVLDLAISSRPLKEEELKQGATQWAYAKTPFVLAVDRHATQTSLSSAEVIAIYDGSLSKWENGVSVRLILRPETEADTVLLKHYFPKLEAAMKLAYKRRGLPIAATDQDAADLIQKISGAVGPSTLALIMGEDRPMKALALNGSMPTVENIQNGSYPLSKTLYLVTGLQPKAEALQFIRFMRSPQGVEILQRTGHLLIPKE